MKKQATVDELCELLATRHAKTLINNYGFDTYDIEVARAFLAVTLAAPMEVIDDAHKNGDDEDPTVQGCAKVCAILIETMEKLMNSDAYDEDELEDKDEESHTTIEKVEIKDLPKKKQEALKKALLDAFEEK